MIKAVVALFSIFSISKATVSDDLQCKALRFTQYSTEVIFPLGACYGTKTTSSQYTTESGAAYVCEGGQAVARTYQTADCTGPAIGSAVPVAQTFATYGGTIYHVLL